MKQNIKWGKLTLCVLIPLAAGGLGALLAGESMEHYNSLYKPLLSPPSWVFPVIWTLLYVLMGIASYLVLTSEVSEPRKKRALTVYGVQLAVNMLWPLLFFRLEAYLLSFIWLALLWLLIWLCELLFRYIRKAAGDLLIPYLLWVFFAGYLNLGIYLLN